ncbi:MAG: copper homeostasis protein CutC [Chitinophagaceae bacterium]
MNFILEVIGFNIDSCLKAQEAGANRIELCASPAEGGTTPSYGFIRAACEKLQIPVYPIIRPRGGDFIVTEEEFNIMLSDIRISKELGSRGVVIGMLQTNGSIDKQRCQILVEAAYPMGVTFHRAFDRVKDPMQALEDIIEIGCVRILSSGLQPTAMEGAETLYQLNQQSNGRIIIMPGSGVRSNNIVELAQKTGATEFHSSARINIASHMNYTNMNMQENLTALNVDQEEIKNIIGHLKQL